MSPVAREGVVADPRRDARGPGAPAHHLEGVLARESPGREPPAAERSEEGSAGLAGDARGIDVGEEPGLEVVVARQPVVPAPLLPEPDPEPPAGPVRIPHVHEQGRAHPGERVGHEGDEGAIAESGDGVLRNGVEQPPALGSGENRRPAGSDRVRRAAHGGGGIGRQRLADDEPVEEAPNRRELLLDGRRAGAVADSLLDPGGDVDRSDGPEIVEAMVIEPAEQPSGGARVGGAGVAVADVGGEELDPAPRGRIAEPGDGAGHGDAAGARARSRPRGDPARGGCGIV